MLKCLDLFFANDKIYLYKKNKMQDFFDSKLNICIFTASGVEKALKSELYRLGYGDVPVINGEAKIVGNLKDVAKLNLNLRTADRIYVLLNEFTCQTFDELFDGVHKIDWGDILPKNALFSVDGKCVKSTLYATSACQSIVKKAVAKKLSKAYNIQILPEDGCEYQIFFKIFKDNAQILLNTSGDGLHKRGYRDLVGIAPIKETLASALVLYSDFYWQNPFIDPFCGSGTIAIEATKIALNIAGSKGRTFAFESWENFDKRIIKLLREESVAEEKLDRKVEIFASDIDKKAIALATHHAEKAGLKKYIKFNVAPVKDLKSELKYGTVVTNPPYGERVYDKRQAEQCYKDFGAVFEKLTDWSAFTITSDKNFERFFGKRADRIRKLYNSNKECNFYYFYGKKEKDNK